jgi:16S rRNA (guanine1516-N2)-methyltransferase
LFYMTNLQSTPFPIVTREADSLCAEVKNLIKSGVYQITSQSDLLSFLSFDDGTLSIHLNTDNTVLILAIDFVGGKSQHRRQYGGGKNQPLAKACGLDKHPQWTIFDATAGLGRDAFVLASLGAKVTLCEQHPALYALLLDAMHRASEDTDVCHIVERMQCVHHDSISYLKNIDTSQPLRPDVIYLDPMYPERKKSAKIKKEMQILQELVEHTASNNGLLDMALKTAKYRVVVKRPKSAPALDENRPSYTVSSVNTRYDVYVA